MRSASISAIFRNEAKLVAARYNSGLPGGAELLRVSGPLPKLSPFKRSLKLEAVRVLHGGLILLLRMTIIFRRDDRRFRTKSGGGRPDGTIVLRPPTVSLLVRIDKIQSEYNESVSGEYFPLVVTYIRLTRVQCLEIFVATNFA